MLVRYRLSLPPPPLSMQCTLAIQVRVLQSCKVLVMWCSPSAHLLAQTYSSLLNNCRQWRAGRVKAAGSAWQALLPRGCCSRTQGLCSPAVKPISWLWRQLLQMQAYKAAAGWGASSRYLRSMPPFGQSVPPRSCHL